MELLNYTVNHKINFRWANIIMIVVNRQKSKTLHTCLLTCNTSSTPRRNASLVRLLCSPTAKLSEFWTPSSLMSMLAGAPTIEPKPTATATSAARTTTLAFHILTRDDSIINNKSCSQTRRRLSPSRRLHKQWRRCRTWATQAAANQRFSKIADCLFLSFFFFWKIVITKLLG